MVLIVFAAAGFKKTADEWECLADQSPTVSYPSETATSWVGTGTVSPETESLFILLERLSSWEDSSGGKHVYHWCVSIPNALFINALL